MNGGPGRSEPPVDPRVLFAAERTLLAWVRTGLALMGFGFVVARFGLFLREMAAARGEVVPPGHPASTWIGVGLVALGVVVSAAAARRYREYVAGLLAGGDPPVPGAGFGVVVAGVLTAAGLALAAFLLGAG